MKFESVIFGPLLDWQQEFAPLADADADADADTDAKQVLLEWRSEEKEVGDYNNLFQVSSSNPSFNISTTPDLVDRVVHVGMRAPRGKNDWFRDLCRDRFEEYRAAPLGRTGKRRITIEIIEMVLEQGGNFMDHDSQTEMDFKDVIEKVQSTFRCIAKCDQRRRKKHEQERARLRHRRLR